MSFLTYSLFQKNGYIFAIVYSSKCVTVFLNQTLYSILKNSWKCRCITIGKLFHKIISTHCDSAVLQNSLSLTYFFYFYSFPFKYIVRFFMWVMVLSTLPITFSVFPVGKTFFSMNDSFFGSNYVGIYFTNTITAGKWLLRLLIFLKEVTCNIWLLSANTFLLAPFMK